MAHLSKGSSVGNKKAEAIKEYMRERKKGLVILYLLSCLSLHFFFFTCFFLFFIHIFFFCDFFPHSLNFLQMCIFLLYYFCLTFPCSSLLSHLYASPPISWSFALSPAVSSVHRAPSWRFLCFCFKHFSLNPVKCVSSRTSLCWVNVFSFVE